MIPINILLFIENNYKTNMLTIMGEDGVDDKSVKKNDTISVRGGAYPHTAQNLLSSVSK